MTWFYFAAGSVIFFTSLNILQRKLAVDCDNPRAMAVVFNIIAAFLALIIFILTGAYSRFYIPTNSLAWLTLAIACFMYGLFERGRFRTAKLLDASTYSIIENISVLIAFIGALFLYSEVSTPSKMFGASLVILALFIVSYKKTTKTKISLKSIAIGVLVFSFLGLGWMLDKKGATYFNSDTYSIFIWIIPIVIIYFPYLKLEDIIGEFKISSWKVFVLAGLNVIGYLMQLKALEMHEATVVIPVVQTSTLFTVLFGIFFLNEKENALRKIFAGILAVAGVYFLI